MIQVLILYASSTGNTEQIACLLQQNINQKEFNITMKSIEFEEMESDLLTHYDGILFGTYTYDDGDLPFETEIFCDSLRNIDLKNKVVGVFGSGDTSYISFCEAVDLMKEEFQDSNATVVEHTVKVDLYPDEEEELLSIKKLAGQFQLALADSPLTRTVEYS